MKTAGIRAASAALVLLAAAAPARAGPQPFVGEVMTVSASFCPEGFLETNGQILQIASYEVLFTLIGTTYGGDGATTFALPANRPTHAGNGAPLRHCIAWAGVYPNQD